MDEAAETPSDEPYGKFVVYVDESGDHSLLKVDAGYPIFVLSFCVFDKKSYAENVVPAVETFKFAHFGHDIVILHERDIRKETGAFRFPDRARKKRFIQDLTEVIAASDFTLLSCIIDKRRLDLGDDEPQNPYHLALGFCAEALLAFLTERGQHEALTHIVFEKRGDREDKELELEFRRLCSGANPLQRRFPFEIVLADKKVNSTGLQLADLVARPIGLAYLRPGQENRAFDVLKRKVFRSDAHKGIGEGFEGRGVTVFPPLKSEKPR
jgi:hypothetical protein